MIASEFSYDNVCLFSASYLIHANRFFIVANHDTTLIEAPLSEPPSLKGYLNKYTNVAKGYNTRWFVLKAGVLSCKSSSIPNSLTSLTSCIDYRHQEDETVASRGSISMKTALLKTSISGADRLRFEVHSTPSRGHNSGVQKWYMKANHPVEASRWTQAISKSIEWYKRENNESGNNSGTGTDGERRRRSVESDESGLMKTAFVRSTRVSMSSVSLLGMGSLRRQHTTGPSGGAASEVESGNSSIGGGDVSPDLNQVEDQAGKDNDADDEDDPNDESSVADSTKTPPHESNFDLHGNSMAAQMELTSQLLTNLALPPGAPQRSSELKTALKESLGMVHGMMNEYMQMASEREEWWKKQLEKEKERQSIWQESLATVVKEGETLEKELRMRSRNRGSRFFDSSVGFGSPDGMGTVKGRSSLLARPASIFEERSPSPVALSPAQSETLKTPQSLPVPSRSLTQETVTVSSINARDVNPAETETIYDTDEEDEFFDAIESNTLPNLVVSESLKSPSQRDGPLPIGFVSEPYESYRNLRARLNLENERPSTSLWSVLKHSIGKDLTKISFPVFFNEPTSMLQRMVSYSILLLVCTSLIWSPCYIQAEDMEFTECREYPRVASMKL